MAYNAIIAKVDRIDEIPNADNIVLATVLNENVVVKKDTSVGDIGVFFPDGGQLSEEYCEKNDLIVRKDENGNKIGGEFFDHKRRVKTQTFRGCKSEGLFMPLESLEYTGFKDFKVGSRFKELNGHPICNKYILRNRQRVNNTNNKNNNNSINELKQYLKKNFPEHFDTSQFRHVLPYEIKKGSLIYITEKLHGTSGRSTYCHMPVKPNWFMKLGMWLGLINKNTNMTTLKDFHGSRRVVFTKDKKDSFYNSNFREDIHDVYFKDKLLPGETVYYEIVGYEPSGKPIMPLHDTRAIKDKKLRKKVENAICFKGEFVYQYGCVPGLYDVYVYRMTKHDIHGNVVEYSWNQIVDRCKEMDVNVVPCNKFNYLDYLDHVLENNTHKMSYPLHDGKNTPIVYDGNFEKLSNIVETATEYQIQDTIDPSHVREGICIRVESPNGKVKVYKNKTFVFKVMEGIAKEKYVDPEDDLPDSDDVEADPT